MEVKYSRLFEKDLKSLLDKSVVLKVGEIISEIEATSSLQKMKGIKHLKGHKNCYRIRIGNYRLGLLLEGKVVWLARIMDRKEIYRYFP
jgi:mRNA interferase RelE/StbE